MNHKNGSTRFFPGLVPLAILCLWAATGYSELIPAARLTNWAPGTRTGVIGGIPTNRTHLIDVTQAPYNADKTGATDAQPAIQAAINAAAPGDVVYLPAGTYLITNTITLGYGRDNITLRGAGPTQTIIDQQSNVGIKIGASGYGPPDYTPLKVTSGISRGSTTVTVNGDLSSGNLAANLPIGKIILFGIQSDQTLPVVSVYNYDVFTDQAPTNQAVRIVSKTNNTITFFPPLFDDYGAGSLEVRIVRAVQQVEMSGIEDLTLDATNYTGGNGGAQICASIENGYNCWLKNCKIRQAMNYNVVVTGPSLNCEVRHCYLDGLKGSGTNGAGLLFGGHSCLIEDNIIVDSFPIVEVNGGSAGNAFAYNYSSPTGMWDTNHAPHNQFNLYEGNALGFQISDGYFGSEANLTLFRNYFHGDYGVNLKRFTRNTSVVGNMLPNAIVPSLCGDPNMGNGAWDGTAQLSAGMPWRDWHMTGKITARTDDNHAEVTLNSGRLYSSSANGTQSISLIWGAAHDQQSGATVSTVSGNVVQIIRVSQALLPAVDTVVSIGPGAFFAVEPGTGAFIGSYQERDLDVGGTLVQKGNRNRSDNSFQSLGSDSLPDSLFRTSKPSWFNDRTWPPYDPVTPRPPSVEDIPAGYRYVHGVEPPGGSSTPPQPPTNLRVVPPGSR